MKQNQSVARDRAEVGGGRVQSSYKKESSKARKNVERSQVFLKNQVDFQVVILGQM